MTQPTETIAVVGGGLAGLVAANLLAREGRRVRLFETAATLGGRASTRSAGGFHFNLGPHALYRDGEAARTCRELGIELVGSPPPRRGQVLAGGRLHRLPYGPWGLLTTTLIRGADRLEMARIFARLPGLSPEPWTGRPAGEWVASMTGSPVLRDLLTSLIRLTTYTAAPDLLDAGATLVQLQRAAGAGVLYLDRGWSQLVDALAASATAAGAELTTSARVQEVLLRHTSGRPEAAGIRLADGTEVPASAVVLALPPGRASRLVDGGRHPGLRKLAGEATPVRLACLDLGLRRRPRGPWFVLGIDEPVYLAVHSDVARLAPSGGALVHLARYLRPGEELARDAAVAELESLADRVLPGWREDVIERRMMPRLTVAHDIPRPGRTPDATSVDGLDRLVLAGDAYSPLAFLADAAAASARRAVAALARQPARRRRAA